MDNTYIITDNQFFALGAVGLLSRDDVTLISPDQIIQSKKMLYTGLVYVYIKNRLLYRIVCHFLQCSKCKLIFMIDYRYEPILNSMLSTRLWSAKLSKKDFYLKCNNINNYINSEVLTNISSSRRQHIFRASTGLKSYKAWVNNRSVNPKGAHSHHRILVNTIGLDSVSVHNLILSEYISLAYATIYRIEHCIGDSTSKFINHK